MAYNRADGMARMFSRIAPRYGPINRVISLGMDHSFLPRA